MRTRNRYHGSTKILGFAMLAGAGVMAGAQDALDEGLEEVMVTAQIRAESLQDVPISVQALDGERLAEAGIARLDDLKIFVPNLQVTETGTANLYYIRGIGSGLNQGFEQSVSTFQDGVYHGRGYQTRMPFLDLERIEVLRGPQPILFGKNAIAGAVNMISAKPTEEFSGMIKLTAESETGGRTADAVLSGPLGANFGARLAVRKRDYDGYVTNLVNGADEPQRDELGGRLTLAYTGSEKFDANLRVEMGRFDVLGRQVEIFGEQPAAVAQIYGPNGVLVARNPLPGSTGLPYNAILRGYPLFAASGVPASVANNTLDGQRTSNGDRSEINTNEYALTFNWELPFAQLTSITGHSAYDSNDLCDCDFTGASVFNATITEDFKQTSQELRLVSPTDKRVDWIAGVYWQKYALDETDALLVPTNSLLVPLFNALAAPQPGGTAVAGSSNPRVYTLDSKLISAFAQATFNATERVRITAGGRWSKEDKDATRVSIITGGPGGALAPLRDGLYSTRLRIFAHSVAGSRSESNFSPLVNAQFDFGDDNMAYLSWTKGFKSGGFDTRSNQAPAGGGTFEYENEESKALEAGLKFRTKSAEFNVALFDTDYDSLQTSVFDGALGFNVGTGDAKVRGAEIDARFKLGAQWLLTGSLAFTDFEWRRYTTQCYEGAVGVVPQGRSDTGVLLTGNCNYAGFGNALTPRSSGSLSAAYTHMLANGLTFGWVTDLAHQTRTLVAQNLDPRSAQAAVSRVNLRLSLSGAEDRWQVAVLGQNLTDERVVGFAGDTPLSGAIFSAPSRYAFVEPGQRIALEASYRF